MLSDKLKKQLIDLGPWHFKIKIDENQFTSDYNIQNISIVDPNNITNLFKRIYPNGKLDGKTFLDVGCNGGGYCFVAHSRGAKFAYGFDVRDHWVNQANFLRKNIFKLSKKSVNFEVKHLEDLPENKKFDFTLFKGVFYHLPDPIQSLKKLCSITNEIIVIDTAGSIEAPDNCLELYFEKPGALMNGVDNLAWLPGGPQVVCNMLKWLGFKETRIWNQDNVYQPNGYDKKFMRFRVIGARSKNLLNRYDRVVARQQQAKL